MGSISAAVIGCPSRTARGAEDGVGAGDAAGRAWMAAARTNRATVAKRPPIGTRFRVRESPQDTKVRGGERATAPALSVEGHRGEADHAAGVDVPLLVVAQRAPPRSRRLEERVHRRRSAPVQG